MKKRRLKIKEHKILTLTDLERYLQDIFIHKGNYLGPVGLVFQDGKSQIYALPNGAHTGREGWKLFNKTINEQHEKVV